MIDDIFSDEPVQLPPLFAGIEDRFFCPEWWKMDDEAPAVFIVDINKSIRANKVILEESYCMTRWVCGSIEKHGRVLKDHKWTPAMED